MPQFLTIRLSLVFFLSVISYSDCSTISEAGLVFSQPPPPFPLQSQTSASTFLPKITSNVGVDPVMISESNGGTVTKPDHPIRICNHRDSESLNQCLRNVLEEIKPRIAEGIPEVGLPGMDPLIIPHLSFEHGSGPVKIMAEFNDVEITGLSQFNKSDFWVDIEKQVLDFDVSFPHMLLAGSYKLSGNLFFVPIAGNGHFWLNLGGVSSKGSGNLGSLTDGTHRRVALQKTEVDLRIESIKVHLTDLFNGDRLLGSVINNFLNENSNEIFQELRPQIGSQVADMLTLIANRALSALPADYFDDLPPPTQAPTIT